YKELALQGHQSNFTGYDSLQEETRVLALVVEGQETKEISQGQSAQLILERSPFYPESGGQVGDQGTITSEGFLFEVTDVQRPVDNLIVCIGNVKKGKIAQGANVLAKVDEGRRL